MVYRLRKDAEANRISIPAGDFDVKDGKVDLSGVRKQDRREVERQLRVVPVLEAVKSAPAAKKNENAQGGAEN